MLEQKLWGEDNNKHFITKEECERRVLKARINEQNMFPAFGGVLERNIRVKSLRKQLKELSK